MGKVIHLQEKLQKPSGNLICLSPWEFRRSDWGGRHFIQMLKSQSTRLEYHRDEICKKGGKGVWHIPSHFSLKGGMFYTIRAMYTCRDNEYRMREIYYLAGLMDCLINQVNSILRTDLLKAMYNKVFEMKRDLNIHWYGPLDQVLLPVESQFYNEFEYRSSLTRACTMKALYRAIRTGTDKMFDILSLEYVFYCPGVEGRS
jgi:hypothetical protein